MCDSQCMGYVKKEFQLKNLTFRGVHRARFGHSQWPIPPGVYLGYRFLLAAYTTFWLFWYTDWDNNGLIYKGTKLANYAFLTVWTYHILTIYLILHFLVCLVHTCTRGGNCCRRPSPVGHRRMFNELETQPSLWASNSGSYGSIPVMESHTDTEEEVAISHVEFKLPWYYKLVWALYNTATVGALLVTCGFFLFLWPQLNQAELDMLNFQVHAANSIIIFLDSLVVAIPTRVLHFTYPSAYGFLYLIFSAIYWAYDHNHVMYPGVLDWNNPGQTMVFVVILAFVFVPLLHLTFFGIYKLKLYIYDILFPEQVDD